jgi:mono/diheme cytochrome c family protein
MKTSALLLAAAFGLAGAAHAPAVHAQTAPAAAAPAGNVAHGKKLMLDYGCADCHGTSGEGGGNAGPKLTPSPLPFNLFAHQLRAPRARMPVYTPKTTSDQDVADLYAYIRSIPKPLDAKDIPLLNR